MFVLGRLILKSHIYDIQPLNLTYITIRLSSHFFLSLNKGPIKLYFFTTHYFFWDVSFSRVCTIILSDIDCVTRFIRICRARQNCTLRICIAHSPLSNQNMCYCRFSTGWVSAWQRQVALLQPLIKVATCVDLKYFCLVPIARLFRLLPHLAYRLRHDHAGPFLASEFEGVLLSKILLECRIHHI